MSTFDEIIDKVLAHEGGYSFDKDDPGGETNFGISKKAFPDIDIKALTRDEAKELYKRHYWKRFKVGSVSDRLRYIYFDMCVNMGGGRAVKILQQAANNKNSSKIEEDGALGPMTIGALSNIEDWRVRSFRVMYYATLIMKRPELEKYWVGWFKRSCEV